MSSHDLLSYFVYNLHNVIKISLKYEKVYKKRLP